MVGIVIVSHSFGIGEEILKLCHALKFHEFPIVNASGMDDGILGTNPLKIAEALEKADEGEGVIVLCDLGSSVMSSEMALDLLEETHHVIIADAPIVEGAIVAASVNSPGLNICSLYEEILESKNVSKF